jgi:predicted membrane protein
MNVVDIVGYSFFSIPFIFMLVFFFWLYKEEKRREQLRIQRNEEWKREIQAFKENAKSISQTFKDKKFVIVDLSGKSLQEQLDMIELVKKEISNDRS